MAERRAAAADDNALSHADASARPALSDPGSHKGPSVGAIVAATDDAGRVLLVWQTAGPYAGHWLLPGGAVERNETVLEGARREVREETGYELGEARLVCAYDVVSEPRGAFHIVLFMYRGRVHGRPKAEAGSDVRWSDLSDVALHPALRRELHDAAIREDDGALIARDLAVRGARMERIT